MAVIEPAIFARFDCTPSPITATSTTTAESDALTHSPRSRAALRRSSSIALYLRRPASVRIRLADGAWTLSCRAR